jgi:hypothetical protein
MFQRYQFLPAIRLSSQEGDQQFATPSIYPSTVLVEIPVRTNDHQFDRSSDIFFGLSTNKIKYKVKYCYATDLQWRWVWGPPSQKIGFFFP